MTSLINKQPARPLTAHDLLKTFAVIIMIADHLGAYFFPDNLWWRAIGRIGFPIWFYLIGHAMGRDIPLKLWGGALFLLVMNGIVGLSLLSLNALVTIMTLRVLIDPVMDFLKRNPLALWPLVAVLAVLIYPTNILMEYGTQALLFAMMGYMVRRSGELPFSGETIRAFALAAALIFLFFQWFDFGFSTPQFFVMVAGTMGVVILLLDFHAADYPRLTAMTPAPLCGLARFCGRYTLEIYVVHLTIFKLLAVYWGYQYFGWFDFHIIR